MFKLLSLIGTLSVGSSAVTPIVIANHNVNEEISTDVEKGMMYIFIDNDKHFDSEGNLILGTQDYKEILIKEVERQRQFNQENGVTNFEIKESTTRFPGTQKDGEIQVGRNIARIVNAVEYEILNVNVNIEKLDNFGNFTYAIEYTAIADGEQYTENLYGYQPKQALTDFQIKPGYVIQFETEYEIGNSIEYTDNNFESGIYLPDLGIDFLVWQVIDMFNYSNSNFNSDAIDYINKTMNTKIESATSIEVYSAVKNNEGYEKGSQILNDEVVSDEYFYVSFTSSDATGTFNMLVHK
ncbi:hypothetical protein [Spiroplasma culicicola]|uniref:Uncharacterized protein n=1 Tax=Spiroplasma culicicola AES-1 TaxID=1276246 RepID=W6A6U4_9MOLU|nr:hypothetical protein [Spiroplasma culicicola]AHI52843.1 hypothetical protein SCULI_v1c05020 [Spiroplasma culicicola AES-1]